MGLHKGQEGVDNLKFFIQVHVVCILWGIFSVSYITDSKI